MQSLPPTVDSKTLPATHADEWADSTTRALGSSQDKTSHTDDESVPMSTTNTQDYPIPGAFPHESVPGAAAGAPQRAFTHGETPSPAQALNAVLGVKGSEAKTPSSTHKVASTGVPNTSSLNSGITIGAHGLEKELAGLSVKDKSTSPSSHFAPPTTAPFSTTPSASTDKTAAPAPKVAAASSNPSAFETPTPINKLGGPTHSTESASPYVGALGAVGVAAGTVGAAAGTASTAVVDSLPPKEQVASALGSAEDTIIKAGENLLDTAKAYLPTSVSSYLPGTSPPSLPSEERDGARAFEHVDGAGALPGSANEAGVAVVPDERKDAKNLHGVTLSGGNALHKSGIGARALDGPSALDQVKAPIADAASTLSSRIPSSSTQATSPASQTTSLADKALNVVPASVAGAAATAASYLPGTNTTDAPHTSLPSRETSGARPFEHSSGVGALPGPASEAGVAVLPDQRKDPNEFAGVAMTSSLGRNNNLDERGLGASALGGTGSTVFSSKAGSTPAAYSSKSRQLGDHDDADSFGDRGLPMQATPAGYSQLGGGDESNSALASGNAPPKGPSMKYTPIPIVPSHSVLGEVGHEPLLGEGGGGASTSPPPPVISPSKDVLAPHGLRGKGAPYTSSDPGAKAREESVFVPPASFEEKNREEREMRERGGKSGMGGVGLAGAGAGLAGVRRGENVGQREHEDVDQGRGDVLNAAGREHMDVDSAHAKDTSRHEGWSAAGASAGAAAIGTGLLAHHERKDDPTHGKSTTEKVKDTLNPRDKHSHDNSPVSNSHSGAAKPAVNHALDIEKPSTLPSAQKDGVPSRTVPAGLPSQNTKVRGEDGHKHLGGTDDDADRLDPGYHPAKLHPLTKSAHAPDPSTSSSNTDYSPTETQFSGGRHEKRNSADMGGSPKKSGFMGKIKEKLHGHHD